MLGPLLNFKSIGLLEVGIHWVIISWYGADITSWQGLVGFTGGGWYKVRECMAYPDRSMFQDMGIAGTAVYSILRKLDVGQEL